MQVEWMRNESPTSYYITAHRKNFRLFNQMMERPVQMNLNLDQANRLKPLCIVIPIFLANFPFWWEIHKLVRSPYSLYVSFSLSIPT
jgi:hypothetical protein